MQICRVNAHHIPYIDCDTAAVVLQRFSSITWIDFVWWTTTLFLLGHNVVARQRHEPLAEQATPGLDHVVVSAAATAAITVTLFPPL